MTQKEKEFYILQNNYQELSRITNNIAKDFANMLFQILKETGVASERAYLNCYDFGIARVSLSFSEYDNDSNFKEGKTINLCFTYDLDSIYKHIADGDYIEEKDSAESHK